MEKERCRNEYPYVARDEKERAKTYVNPTREEYLSKDRQCIYREVVDKHGNTCTIELFRVGEKGITEKDIEILAELYQEEDQSYFNLERLTGKRTIVEDKDFGAEGTISGSVSIKEDVFDQAFPELKEESDHDKMKKLVKQTAHRVLKGRRLYIFIQHFECNRNLKDILEDVNKGAEKPISESAIDKVWYRIVDRLCSELGLPRQTIRHNKSE